jgi:hypothetical protein
LQTVATRGQSTFFSRASLTDNKQVGAWLNNILKKGGTEDWRKLLKEGTGEDILYPRDHGLLQAAYELVGRTKQRPADRMGVGGSRCPQRDMALVLTRRSENALHLQHIICLCYFGD